MARVLIVDDEVNIRKLYKSELEDEGYEVVTAASGAEALHILRDSAPDLVILDIKLEQENGLDFLRHLMEIRPSISVILNSGYSTYKDDFSSWLADAYLVKSSDTSELKDKVRELISARTVAQLASSTGPAASTSRVASRRCCAYGPTRPYSEVFIAIHCQSD
jgi:DNA-binding response OmpR family regulator